MSDVVEKQPLTEDYLKKMDAYWRAVPSENCKV